MVDLICFIIAVVPSFYLAQRCQNFVKGGGLLPIALFFVVMVFSVTVITVIQQYMFAGKVDAIMALMVTNILYKMAWAIVEMVSEEFNIGFRYFE
jgi:hypothetical protein